MANGCGHFAMICLVVLLAPFALGGDPMAPPNARDKGVNDEYSRKVDVKKSKKQRYILRQIVNRKKDKSAVINGYIVNEGSYINNAYVRRIKENSVVLSVKGKRKEIMLESKLPRIRH